MPVLLGFTFFMGLMISSLIAAVLGFKNGSSLVMTAFGGTAGVFFVMASWASVIKRDLSGMGKWLFVGAIVIMVGGIKAWQKDYSRPVVQMRMRQNGSLSGKGTWLLRGLEEVNSRGNQFLNQNEDQAQWVNDWLARNQETGTGRILPTEPTNLDEPWKVETDFELDPLVNVPGPSAITIPYGLAPGKLYAMASFKAIETHRFPQACSSTEFRETTTLKFPSKIKITRIPANVKASIGSYHYQARYRLKGQTILVYRIYRSKRSSPFCEASVNRDWNQFRQVLQRDLRGQVFFR